MYKSLNDRLADQAKARAGKVALGKRVGGAADGRHHSAQARDVALEATNQASVAAPSTATGATSPALKGHAEANLNGAAHPGPSAPSSAAQSAANGALHTIAVPAQIASPAHAVPAALLERVEVSLLRDDDPAHHEPGSALRWLVDLYLKAAEQRSRHIAVVWPVFPKHLQLVHALATLERWRDGDKMGVRGMLYPVKSNVFHALNRYRLDHHALIRMYAPLQEDAQGAAQVPLKRGCRDRDAIVYAFNSRVRDATPPYYQNPALSELLPHYYAGPETSAWSSCAGALLAQLGAKLQGRSHATSLRSSNCVNLGHPAKAPDALFALDGRLNRSDLERMFRQLKLVGRTVGLPEVVLIHATRAIRKEASGWAGSLARFCMQLEEFFGVKAPGVLVVTDEPPAAYQLQRDLRKYDAKRAPELRWKHSEHAFRIEAQPSPVPNDGLLPTGQAEPRKPMPREIVTDVVDAQAAGVAQNFYRIAGELERERVDVKPLRDAARHLRRVAAWPCGARDVHEWLEESGADQDKHASMSWAALLPALTQFMHRGDAGEHHATLKACISRASKFVQDYENATPLALRMVHHVEARLRRAKQLTLVLPTEGHRRLARRFLGRYDRWQEGVTAEVVSTRVMLATTVELQGVLASLAKHGDLLFVGLDAAAESLRTLMVDDRVPKHVGLLLTQQNGQYLRSCLVPLVEHHAAFKSWKPRMESILRGLANVPPNDAVLSDTDLGLPSVRSAPTVNEASAEDDDADPNAWTVQFDDDRVVRRSPAHRVHLYDPANREASGRGFLPKEVRKLSPGDNVCLFTPELRDQVADALTKAGIALQRDVRYEELLRLYHQDVMAHVNDAYPSGTFIAKVRAIRAAILAAHPKWVEELPEEQSVRAWVDLGRTPFRSFSELRPQAPAKREHFMALASVIGMSESSARRYWDCVINPLRNARRHDGRNLSDECARMLLQPESVEVHKRVPRQTLNQLFDHAMQCLHTVEGVIPSEGGMQEGEAGRLRAR